MMEGVDHEIDDLAEINLTEAEIDAMMADGHPVEVVGPPSVHFEIVARGPRQYLWRLSRETGEILATSEIYPTKKAARQAAEEIKKASAHAVLVDLTAG
jgi:uncharacterized protein YegP (UPF0339 family)